MKRKTKARLPVKERANVEKNIYDLVGVSGEILANEPKMVITGDYLIEIYNHKGIVDFSDTVINVNTKPCVYKITGVNLEIRGVTDDEVSITGTTISVERI
jgi:sporulation protein YqfC